MGGRTGVVVMVTAVSVLSIVFIVIRVFNWEQGEVDMMKQCDTMTGMVELLLTIYKQCT